MNAMNAMPEAASLDVEGDATSSLPGANGPDRLPACIDERHCGTAVRLRSVAAGRGQNGNEKSKLAQNSLHHFLSGSASTRTSNWPSLTCAPADAESSAMTPSNG